jgi:hypothetical protein
VAKELKLRPEDEVNIYKSGLHEKINERIGELADDECWRVLKKIRLKTYVVIVEGDLTLGVKNCEIDTYIDFSEMLHRWLVYKSHRRLDEGDWEIVEYDNSPKSWEEVDDEDEFDEEDEGSFKTRFEETLRDYIPSIFEEDVQEFILAVSRIAVRETVDRGASEEEIPYYVKDAISDEMFDIINALEKLGSKYINIIKGKLDIGTNTCRIVRADEFFEKLYRATYNRALYLLDYGPAAAFDNYFDMDKFWSN